MENIKERTLVIIKPDGVERKLIGECISRFERAGFDIVEMKMMKIDEAFARKHYNKDDKWCEKVGKRTIEEFKQLGYNPKEVLGSEDPLTVGREILNNLIKYVTRGKLVVMIVEGYHAIEKVRRLVGHTYPLEAAPGTIRGDYSSDTAFLSAYLHRSVENIIHASENKEDAEKEIRLWFGEEYI